MSLLDKVREEVDMLKKAHNLLEEIWLEVGPYDNTYSTTIRYKLQDYFKFDDSE